MDHYFTNNTNLESKIKEIKYQIFNESFIFYSDEGVFSKNRIDSGTNLLLNTYLEYEDKSKSILDVGCGYGVIGIVLSKVTSSSVDMIDVNKRSVHLAIKNIKKNECKSTKAFYSDAYNSINNKYDIIITNPPIRVGKSKLLEILINAKEYLNKNGELWFVIRKDQGALSIYKELEKYYKILIKNKRKGYIVYCAKK